MPQQLFKPGENSFRSHEELKYTEECFKCRSCFKHFATEGDAAVCCSDLLFWQIMRKRKRNREMPCKACDKEMI